eukprot:m.272394 g.272394  ORF g.272394 m.272394 type:complete len:368 (-) comp101056_c0_seq1:59-1162(-)
MAKLILVVVVLLLLSTTTAINNNDYNRVELHIHLDGSITVQTLLEIAQFRNMGLPPQGKVPTTVEEITFLLNSVQPFARFDIINNIVGGNTTTLGLVAEHFVDRQAASGVIYTEVRYDPVRMAVTEYNISNANITVEEAVIAITAGLQRGLNKSGRQDMQVFQLLCAMRGKSANACMAIANLTAHMRQVHSNLNLQLEKGRGRRLLLPAAVVGMDLAGDETTYPNAEYIDCFRYAKDTLGLNTTVHAGEFTMLEADDVLSAVVEMKADRIGHGYAAASNQSLMGLLKQRKIHLECCPMSASHHGNVQSIGVLHKAGVSLGLNTDDPASMFDNGTLATCEAIVQSELGFTHDDVVEAYTAARAAAFGK